MVRSQDGTVAELDKNGKIIDFCYTHVAYTHTMPVQMRASECLGTNIRVTQSVGHEGVVRLAFCDTSARCLQAVISGPCGYQGIVPQTDFTDTQWLDNQSTREHTGRQ